MKKILPLILCTFIITSCEKDSPAEKILDSIAITEEPTKKNYNINDEFDATGMVITASYNDNSTAAITVTPDMLSYDFSTAGTDKTVTITYQGKTAIVTGITVGASEMTPGITDFTPTEAGYGTTITITGTNFSTTPTDNIVTFNNITAVVELATETELKVTVPKNMECSGLLRVTVAGNTGISSNAFTYTLTYTVSTLAGSTQFSNQSGLVVDASGTLYVADLGNHVIRKITTAGVVSTFAGVGDVVYFADGPVESATFRYPYAVALDASGGTMYVTSDHRIRKITGGIVSTLAGDGTQAFEDGAGSAAKFHGPSGMALDASGNIYVADQGNHRIRKVTPGGVVTTFAGSTFGFTDGTGTNAQFNFPIGVVFDAAGNLYVTDNENSCIRKITSAGVVTTLAGNSSGASGFADGTGSDAKFNHPEGITIDAAGNLFVADRGNNRIRKITPAGVVSTVAGDGKAALTDGVGSVAQIDHPTSITFDIDGNLLVSDPTDSRIRKIIAE